MRRFLKREWLIPAGILLFSFLFRAIQIDTTLFGPEQAWIAEASQNLADLRAFPTHMYNSSANFSQFPLTTYIAFVPYLFSDSVLSLQIHYLILNLLAVGLCWWFCRRYWDRQVAAIATFVYACMPWAILFSLRVWPNTLLPPFVMIWAAACGLAFAEKRPKWLMLAWGAAWLALQLHVSGILLPAVLFILVWLYPLPGRWRYAFWGSLLALLPALPWIYAQLTGAADLELHLATSAGRGGFQASPERIFQFFTARDLAETFLSGGRDNLSSRLAYMQVLAPVWSLLFLISPLFLLWLFGRACGRRRPLYLLLFLWCALSLGFTFFTKAHHTIAYYLPVLPAPCIAVALLFRHLAQRLPRIGALLVAGLLTMSGLNLYAVSTVDQQINEDMRRGDPASHAWSTGDYTPPLQWLLEVAQLVRHSLEAGDAAELILVFHVDKGESADYLRWPFAHLLRGYSVRVLDSRQSHLIYPQQPALFLWNERESEPDENLLAGLRIQSRVGPFHLFRSRDGARPSPRIASGQRAAFENGLQLAGFDPLLCAGSWKLYWTPGPAVEEGNPVHFFVHLLDADSETLAQRDLRAYDPGDWREGDLIETLFDFGRELAGLPVETIRVGLYHFSDDTNDYLSGINALDEEGRPVKYAIDIPLEGPCAAVSDPA